MSTMDMETYKTETKPKRNGRKLQCNLRGRWHHWFGVEDKRHAWKVCSDCGAKRMTHHIACHPVCMFGPG